MAMDFMVFHRIISLVKEELLNGKIGRVSQISNEEFLFEVRNNGKNYHLLISTHPLMPYINLSIEKPSSIPINTNLVFLLRKHLENGKIVSIEQKNDDRIVCFEIANRDEYFQNSIKKVYVELIGRASNLILTDQNDIIIDCLKKIPIQYNNLRTLLPNIQYQLSEKPESYKLPVSIENELTFRNISIEQLQKQIDSSNKIYIVKTESNKRDFHFFPFLNLKGEVQEFEWNQGIEHFYKDILQAERQRQATSSIEKIIKIELKKNKKKLDKLNQDMQNALDAFEYKYYADTLLTYGQEIKKITHPMVVFDQETQQEVHIPMDVRYDIFKNATLLYKKYHKSKVAREKIKEQLEITENQIDYLQSIQYYLSFADSFSLKQIEEELEQQGLYKAKQKKLIKNNNKKQKQKEKVYKPLQYKYNDVMISVGENNLQNEYLTFKIAHKNHYYFHVQKFHGAHVILHTEQLNENLIRMAANLAVLHSETAHSSSVAVDYTQVKNIKKIPGGKPGKVLIYKQKTIYIDPNQDLVKNLIKLS